MANSINNGNSKGSEIGGTRCIALVGPYSCGKTSLLEAILFRVGKIDRQGKVDDGNTVGDASAEARSHGMSIEMNTASIDFLGDKYTFIDCPGSIEFSQEADAILSVCDAAIVVCEADDKKTRALQLTLKKLDDLGLPRFIFVNKIDKTEMRLHDVLEFMQPASETPLVLRQVPIWEGNIATGFVDLALERAFVYREHAPSEVISMSEALEKREKGARFEMLEKLADFDDELLEQLLNDMEPPQDKVFEDLSDELAGGLITPVMFGSAENGNGIMRLLKALRHEVPGIAALNERLDLDASRDAKGGATAQIVKTIYTAHGGKLSVARVLSGDLAEGNVLYGKDGQMTRVAGLFELHGIETNKVDHAAAGELVALARLEDIATGETVSTIKGSTEQLHQGEIMPGVFGFAISVADRKDEVKLTGSVAKLMEEDPSLTLAHDPDTQELVLWGQGEMHLRVALERLAGKFGVEVQSAPRQIAYKESISKGTTLRRRYKKQSGGHGQFGDVELEIKPLPRGAGFVFSDSITGGVVPKQYIPAVKNGTIEYMIKGPLGFQVIDVAVNLSDGSYHNVDSSEMAFKQAARVTMSEAMPDCGPVLLEPIVAVDIHVPNEATPKVNQIVSGHRGQLLGFDARPGWTGWETVQAHMPEAEMANLIVELRSATAGTGTFSFAHEGLARLTGKLADAVIEQRESHAA